MTQEAPIQKPNIFFTFSAVFSRPPQTRLIKAINHSHLFTLATVIHTSEENIVLVEKDQWIHELSDIEVDYAHLFSIPSSDHVIPYESYYIDRIKVGMGDWNNFKKPAVEKEVSGYLNGPSSSELRKLYAEEGFFVAQDQMELPDHIGCELEFLGYLFENNKVEKAKVFFQKHLGKWCFQFLQGVEAHARTDFYKKGAKTLHHFLSLEFS